MLVEFASVVDAVRCAVEVQRGDGRAQRRRRRRTGASSSASASILGDIIVEDDDIYGDGVNIAARLEALAEPGGICVSGRACATRSRGKLDVAFEDLGEQQVKNIARPVRVYRDAPATRRRRRRRRERRCARCPTSRRSRCCRSTNMSGDPEQEYFADGMVEEIITALSPHPLALRHRPQFDASPTRADAVDVKQVGRELGVRYVLEGSVRKAGNRVRITAQLIDAATGAHLWADRFDGELDDIFALQDEVTASVVGAHRADARAWPRSSARGASRTESLDAYDYYHARPAALGV